MQKQKPWFLVTDVIDVNLYSGLSLSKSDKNFDEFPFDILLIRLSRNFVQLVSKRISETFGFCHSMQGGFLLRYTNFGPTGSFLLYEEKNVLRTICPHFPKMSNMEHRAVIMLFTRKALNAIEISKELDNVYKDSAASYRTIAKWVAKFKDPECAFEDAPRMGPPSTITADGNIEAVERIVMRGRQISICRLAEELGIAKTTIHEIMNNHMGMKKVCIWWVPKLFTPIQRANRVDGCQELLQQREVNPDKFFDCIVTGDQFWIHHYDPLNQLEAKVWKRSDEQTPTRLHQERSTGKIMMIIFWDKRWCSAHRVPAM